MSHESNVVLPMLNVMQTSNLNMKKNDKFNSGRWKPNEHEKFLEAIISHGNDWKMVYKCVKSRSSTQARSHAQKYLLKLKKMLNIAADSLNELSKESVNKIIREIIGCSSHKNNAQVNTEKLSKLIMSFASLIIGNVIAPSVNDDNNTLNNSIDRNYSNNGERQGGKAFNIVKVCKGHHLKNPNNNEVLINNNSPSIKTINNNSPTINNNKPDIQIIDNKIQNQNDLLKYLFESQGAYNQGKDVINIISINIRQENDESGASYENILSTLLSNAQLFEKTPVPKAKVNNNNNNSYSCPSSPSKFINNNNSKPVHNKLNNNVNNNNIINNTSCQKKTESKMKPCQSSLTNTDLSPINYRDIRIESETNVNSIILSNDDYEREFYGNMSSFSYFNENQNDEDLFGLN